MSGKKPSSRESTIAPHDLSSVLKDAPRGVWVALSHDKASIAGTGSSAQAAISEAQRNGELSPVLIKMPLEEEGIAAAGR